MTHHPGPTGEELAALPHPYHSGLGVRLRGQGASLGAAGTTALGSPGDTAGVSVLGRRTRLTVELIREVKERDRSSR